MNKNLHRIIFNAKRGQRMAVAETATAQGKTAGGEASSSRHPVLAAVVTAALAACAYAAIAFFALAEAQVRADATAPGNQRATVLAAPNGVPLINIQTPNAAGVSRNTYSQFDVQRNGVILNNSRTAVQTQLGGFVGGNPWMNAPASVILNEVNSSNPSLLRGYVEVAGQRASVIIANPSGIQVDGGGFINANRVTLTTGTPDFNSGGGIDSYSTEHKYRRRGNCAQNSMPSLLSMFLKGEKMKSFAIGILIGAMALPSFAETATILGKSDTTFCTQSSSASVICASPGIYVGYGELTITTSHFNPVEAHSVTPDDCKRDELPELGATDSGKLESQPPMSTL